MRDGHDVPRRFTSAVEANVERSFARGGWAIDDDVVGGKLSVDGA